MKILFIHHGEVPGGAPISLSYTINALHQMHPEWEFVVWCVNKRMQSFFEENCKVKTKLMPSPLKELGKIVIGWTPLLYNHTFQELKTNVRYIRGRINDFATLLKGEHPDVVHLNSGSLIIPAIATKKLGFKLVWHIREVFGGGKFNIRRIVAGKIVRSLADHVITISDVEKKHIGGQHSDNVTTIYNFVEVNKFKPSKSKEEICRELGLDTTKPILISVGGASPRKGLVEIIESVDLTNAQYIIAGPQIENCENVISPKVHRQLRKEDVLYAVGLRPFKFEHYHDRVRKVYQNCSEEGKKRICFIGHKKDIANYIAASDVLVFAGTVPHFARPVYEAWLLKKPVIVFPVEGISTEVEDNMNGFITKKVSGKALAKTINQIFDLPNQKMSLIANSGYIKAFQNFRSEDNIPKFSKIFELINTKEKKYKVDNISYHALPKNSLTLDLGANIGNITQQMVVAGATVYAFEPNPFAYSRLEERFKNNPNVICIQKAVLDEETEIPLYFHENSDEDEVKWSVGSSLLDFKSNVIKEKNVNVPTVDLAKFIFDLGREVDLIKMDVEGVECRLINHLIDSGAIDNVKMLLVETHDHKVPELKKETDALRKRIVDLGLSEKINLNWV